MDPTVLEKIQAVQFTQKESEQKPQEFVYQFQDAPNKRNLFSYFLAIRANKYNLMREKFSLHLDQNRIGIQALNRVLNFSLAEHLYATALFFSFYFKKLNLIRWSFGTLLFLGFNDFYKYHMMQKLFPEDYHIYSMANKNLKELMRVCKEDFPFWKTLESKLSFGEHDTSMGRAMDVSSMFFRELVMDKMI